MNEILGISADLVGETETVFQRADVANVNWSDRLIAVQGHRGTGKTTLLLQHLKLNVDPKKSAYISLDNFYFQNKSLFETAKGLHQLGYRTLVLDEVHKYNGWSREIKSLYDSYRNLQIIFTGSSALEIYKAEADLSRRAVSYHLPILSLREYIELDEGKKLPKFSLGDIIKSHVEIATDLNKKLGSPLKYFNQYLEHGCYPFFKEGVESYHNKLMRTILLVLETDIAAVTNVPYNSIHKMKKLLAFIAQAVPYQPNITELAHKIETNRETALLYLEYLRRAGVIHLLAAAGKTMGPLSKPDKIFLENPNLAYALTLTKPNIGTQRETFFICQTAAKHDVDTSPVSDFFVDNKYTFEIGGRNKNKKQIKTVKNSYVVSDDMVIGNNQHIPLWLFGFLY